MVFFFHLSSRVEPFVGRGLSSTCLLIFVSQWPGCELRVVYSQPFHVFLIQKSLSRSILSPTVYCHPSLSGGTPRHFTYFIILLRRMPLLASFAAFRLCVTPSSFLSAGGNLIPQPSLRFLLSSLKSQDH